ncbi:MAG: sulfatase-like hydrolase/transferase [Ekhidna sp.]|nr:sulfatase-like hydrolase/transferase [Ekhidna sp.]
MLIVADDLGYGDYAIHTKDDALLPVGIQGLVEDGHVFNRAYVTLSVCAPSRAAFPTGLHQHSFGFATI